MVTMAATMVGVIFNWLEIGKDGHIISYRYIRLDDDNTVVWDQQTATCGRWSYGESPGFGTVCVEFSARGTQHWQKHILKELTDRQWHAAYILCPYDEAPSDYDSEELWHKNSVMHSNENTIIMQRVDLPWM